MNIREVAVIGAGTMGRGIAQAFAAHEYQVVFYARRPAGVQEGYDSIVNILDSMVQKGKISSEKRSRTLKNLKTTSTLSDAKDADLVVESIAEELSRKQDMMHRLEELCRPEALLTTNTSSISITAIAANLRYPQRVCGMHFFYPPPKMPVIEVAVARQTSPDTVKTVKEIVASIDKTAIEVQESPGFVFNRLMIPMINEAAYLLMEGVATREDIDAIMCLAASHPIGPLALADIIGLDVCLNIMEVLQHELGDDKYRPCPLLRRMVYGKQLGKKTGKGFYSYTG